MLKRAFLYLLCVACLPAWGQGRKRSFVQREVGILAGGAYYLGDLNPRIHFLYSKPAAGIYFRYTDSYRYAFRFGFNYANVFGDDALSSEADQKERNLNFKTTIYDFHALAEFNFVEYRIGNDKHPFTMFIFAGIGMYYFNPKSNSGASLQLQNSEGVSYSNYQVSLPFGVGIKWNIGDSWGMGLEWGPRKLFTDYLDDVSGKYPLTSATEGGKTVTKAAPGSMRGNPSSRDWYFVYGLTITYKLPPFHKSCFQSI